jgi:hypothetical protein
VALFKEEARRAIRRRRTDLQFSLTSIKHRISQDDSHVTVLLPPGEERIPVCGDSC